MLGLKLLRGQLELRGKSVLNCPEPLIAPSCPGVVATLLYCADNTDASVLDMSIRDLECWLVSDIY